MFLFAAVSRLVSEEDVGLGSILLVVGWQLAAQSFLFFLSLLLKAFRLLVFPSSLDYPKIIERSQLKMITHSTLYNFPFRQELKTTLPY
jgi:hypothetical protein